MAENGDVAKNDVSVYSTYNVYDVTGHRQFRPGNPGRLPGTTNKRSKSAQEIIEAYATEPLVEKMEQLKRLKAKLAAGVWRYDQEEMECEKLLERLTTDVMQYRHTKLKSVESHTQLDIVHKLQALDGMSDAELQQVIDDVEQLTRQRPEGRG